MRVAYFDCFAGISGDMTLGALIDAGADVEMLREGLASLDLPAWRRHAAVWNHRAFYFLLIALPLTGLTAVSGMTTGPTTTLVGGIPFPVIPGVSKATGATSGDLHVVLVYTTIALLLLHVGAALFQQFVEHDRTAGRMPPFQAPDGEHAIIGQGGAREAG